MGCDPDELGPAGTRVEQWDDVPAASEDLAASRATIAARVEHLMEQVRAV